MKCDWAITPCSFVANFQYFGESCFYFCQLRRASRRLALTTNIHVWTTASEYSSCCAVQVWRHGAGHDSRQDRGRSLLAERGACHRLAGACHRVQLQSNLSSKPEGGQEESTKGKVHSILAFSLDLPCTYKSIFRQEKQSAGCNGL